MLSAIRRALRAKDAMAAVEFALIAPILVGLFLGTVELTDALVCDQKVTGLASTAADLIAQETAVTTNDMSNVLAAVNSIVYPYPTASIKVVISSLVDDGHGGAKVAWSCAEHTTARTVNSAVTVPTGVITSGGSVILAEITYPFASSVGKLIVGTRNLTSSFYSRPRRSTTVTGPAACP